MSLPFISVIVPTYARPVALAACLDGLSRSTYPRDRFELIMVDDGTPAALDAIIEPFATTHKVRVLHQPRQGPAAARNRGLTAAAGEFVAFTDDDCVPAVDWLDRIAAQFQRNPAGGIGGNVLNALPENPYATSTDLLIAYLRNQFNRATDAATFFTSNNLAFPIRQLRELGGFAPEFITGEDRDLCERWRLAGHALTYVPEAVVHHAQQLDLAGFCRLHFRYGQGSCRYREHAARRKSAAASVEPLRFYAQLVCCPFGTTSAGRAVLLSGLLGIAQVANAAGFFYHSLSSRHARQASA